MIYSVTSNEYSRRATQILVVEDNPDQWFIIRWTLLQQFPEVEPIWVTDVSQALHYLESCRDDNPALPRLILLDLYVPRPEMSWNLVSIIKSHYLYRDIPVVILSYSNSLEDIRKSYRHGANSYMTKPASYDQWLACFTHFRPYWLKTADPPPPELSTKAQ